MTYSLGEEREPLLSDERLEILVDKLKSEFGHAKLDGATFVTFISDSRQAEVDVKGIKVPLHVEDMATFAIIEPNPRPYAAAKALQVMTHGTVALEDWEEDEKDRNHYVGRRDPAHRIFRAVTAEHVERMDSLRELI